MMERHGKKVRRGKMMERHGKKRGSKGCSA